MNDQKKTKAQLIDELGDMRQRISELEHLESKHKRVEEALQESEAKYRSLVMNIPEVVWTTDSSGRTAFLSSNIEEVYGYTPEEVYKGGETIWLRRIHPDDVGKVKEAFGALFEKGIKFDIEYRIQRKDGQWIWGHDRAIASYEREGVLYADGIFSDITKRKLLEETITLKEAQYRGLFEASMDSLFIFDRNGILKEANPAACEMYGYSNEEMIGLTGSDIVHPDYQRLFKEGLGKRTKSESFYAFSVNIRKDGSPFHVEVKGGHVEYNGEPHVLAIVRDISERKRAEKALQKSEQLYRTLVETAVDGIVLADLNGKYILCNKRQAELLGYDSATELIGRDGFDFFPPDINEATTKAFQRLLDEKHIEDVVFEVVRKDGSRIITEYSATVISDDKGNPVSLMCIMRDITERKWTETKLRESEERFRTFLENLSDIAYETDEKGNITYINKITEIITGIPMENIIGKPFLPLLTEESQKTALDVYQRTLNGETIEYELPFANGRICQFKNEPLRDQDGNIIGVFGIARDLTERKKIEEELEKYRNQG